VLLLLLLRVEQLVDGQHQGGRRHRGVLSAGDRGRCRGVLATGDRGVLRGRDRGVLRGRDRGRRGVLVARGGDVLSGGRRPVIRRCGRVTGV